MRGTALRIATSVFVSTAVLAALAILVPSRRNLFVGIYLFVLAVIAVGTLVGSFRTLAPEPWMRSPFERDPEKPEPPAPIAELDRIDRLVVLGAANEFDLHYRLRPLLRQVAADRLHSRYGVELDGAPDRASSLLGDELWSLVRPDREVGRRTGPGLDPAQLVDHVERLEQL